MEKLRQKTGKLEQKLATGLHSEGNNLAAYLISYEIEKMKIQICIQRSKIKKVESV